MGMDDEVAAFAGRNPEAKLKLREDGAGLVLGIAGSLDLQLSYALQKLLQAVVAELAPGKRLALDLSQVSYISSTGVGALTSALVAAKQRNVGISVCNVPPGVRSILEILGLLGFFNEEEMDG